jgi:hypothetical protein
MKLPALCHIRFPVTEEIQMSWEHQQYLLALLLQNLVLKDVSECPEYIKIKAYPTHAFVRDGLSMKICTT